MQLDLALTTRAGWGGRRSGAGRKRGPNPRIPHLRRERFSRHHPSHVTLRVRGGIPSLRTVPLVRELERAFRHACARRDFRLTHYSIQSNHLHLLVEADGPRALARGMKSLAARVARAVNRVFGLRGRVFPDRFHARALRTPREVRNALAYVLLNARRHLGRVASVVARVDPASSGRWFDGWRRGTAAGSLERPAVAHPRTWLLSVGWRRHGLLDSAEIPGPDTARSRSG
jgi:REP element-mobilizing transposase RayT